jgi:hypothetical protein
MGALTSLGAVFATIASGVIVGLITDAIPAASIVIIRRSTLLLPHRERYGHECAWLADLGAMDTKVGKLLWALGCSWAACRLGAAMRRPDFQLRFWCKCFSICCGFRYPHHTLLVWSLHRLRLHERYGFFIGFSTEYSFRRAVMALAYRADARPNVYARLSTSRFERCMVKVFYRVCPVTPHIEQYMRVARQVFDDAGGVR